MARGGWIYSCGGSLGTCVRAPRNWKKWACRMSRLRRGENPGDASPRLMGIVVLIIIIQAGLKKVDVKGGVFLIDAGVGGMAEPVSN